MNINNFKFIINSGCSYGQMGESIKHPIDSGIYDNLHESIKNKIGEDWFISDDNVVIIDVSLSSMGSEWIADSTIHTINYLLNIGVNKENIYCFIEWSQWSRIVLEPFTYTDVTTDLSFSDRKNFNLQQIGKNQPNEYLIEKFKGLGIVQCNEMHNVGKIGDMIYINPTHTYFENPSPDLEMFLTKSREIERSIPEEKKVKSYFDNILRTQFYLQSQQISYNFCFMQGTFTSWKEEDYGYSQWPESNHYNAFTIIQDNNIVVNKLFDSYMTSEFDIENVVPSIKTQFNLINWDKVWIYESDNFRRGGFDEWCIDSFDFGSMVQPDDVRYFILENNEFDSHRTITGFGYHPNVNLYKLLWNDIAKDCGFFKMNQKWCKEIEELFWDDINSNKPTEHGLTLSKKYLKEKTKYLDAEIDKENGTINIL